MTSAGRYFWAVALLLRMNSKRESVHLYTNGSNKVACHIFISRLNSTLQVCTTTRSEAGALVCVTAVIQSNHLLTSSRTTWKTLTRALIGTILNVVGLEWKEAGTNITGGAPGLWLFTFKCITFSECASINLGWESALSWGRRRSWCRDGVCFIASPVARHFLTAYVVPFIA